VGIGKLVAVLGLSFFGTQAFAASQQDWDGCQSQVPERVIPSCSSIIPDETETPQSRADAYVFRAGAYLAQGNVDRAIADYSEAIKLSPRNVVAYLSRALARFHKGDRDQAILDYAIAEKLDAAAVAQMGSSNSDVGEITAAERAAPPPASALAFVDRLPTVEALAAPPSPPPPPAPPPPPPSWHAIAASIWKVRGIVQVAYGYSGTRANQEAANDSAVSACRGAGGPSCKPIVALSFGCLYITSGRNSRGAGWASGPSTEAAVSKCRSNGYTCKQPIGGCLN
jgi:tetratricopeptide (TPR) repeat protein